tara:strand:- start:81196 stop:83289 length:2094 start_codon:yes stop_codon:yes gene_type:complete
MKTEIDDRFGCMLRLGLKNKTMFLGLLCLLFCGSQPFAQEQRVPITQEQRVPITQDSILPVFLNEVIVIASYKNTLNHHQQHKPLSTLDEYLEASKKVSMMKRGAYAWEPMINDMTSERLSITIDGMRIFGACTDKMDPITSYVDVSNLSDVQVAGGQQGAQHGSTIGGAIDMRLEKSNFKPIGWIGAFESGFEGNNQAKIIGGELNYSNDQFYVDTDFIYRDAENYVAGGGEEVNFSQYEKYNISTNAGYTFGDDKKLLATFIFDEAKDVGYPALPMDVSLARAFIGSVTWQQAQFMGNFTDWESKLYANSITHIMDDSKRPDVPIRMDMPGWSDTYGYYSQTKLDLEKHSFLFKVDGFYNRSLAEMTMYPNNPGEREMFMLTWPDVRTLNTAFYGEDVIKLKNSSLKIGTRLAYQGFHVADDFGLNSLRIFYPEITQRQNRFLKSISSLYSTQFKETSVTAGLSYGDRAPSVSEGFGFYLFNSFDNHDYIGDPNLRNEKAMEGNFKVSVPFKKLSINLEANYFHTVDYIIGVVRPNLSVMTIGADGVKIYENLDYANLYNLSLDGRYKVLPELALTGLVSYHRGQDQNGGNLPFMSPLTYSSGLQYSKGTFSGALTMRGAADQVNFNPAYGEDKTAAYTVFSASFGKSFSLQNDAVYVKAGVENIFDQNYSTYTDWKNIPRMGRNVFMTVSYTIQ